MSPISICLHVLTTIYKVQFFGCSWNYRSNNTYIDVYRYYFSMPVIELFRLIRLHGSLIKSDMPKGMHVSHRHFVSYQKYSLLCVYREGRWEFFLYEAIICSLLSQLWTELTRFSYKREIKSPKSPFGYATFGVHLYKCNAIKGHRLDSAVK